MSSLTLSRLAGSVTGQAPNNHTIELLRRYPFLIPAPPSEMEAWNNLFNATSVSTPVTRQGSPDGDRPPPVARQLNSLTTGINQERHNQNGMGDIGYMGNNSMQLFPSFQPGDFQWWQASGDSMQSQSTDMSHQPVSSTSATTDHDQGLLEFFANSIAPTGTWPVEQGFDSRFLRPNLVNEAGL